jgi:threonine synthase
MSVIVGWRCAGCGWAPPANETPRFRCPNARPGDGVDHLIARRLELSPGTEEGFPTETPEAREPNPFLRYRSLLGSYQAARLRGMTDARFARRVEALDLRIGEVDGRGFRETPFAVSPRLAGALGLSPEALWIKDETANVSGSHKARHLFGLMLWLETVPELAPANARLGIASCGNAALAAAVVARAAERSLEVFVPPDAHPAIARRLIELGARLVPCPREKEGAGDPCFLRFRQAVEHGVLPFTCQGPESGLVIEGGQTLAWEMASQLAASRKAIDRVFVQVGGGALATAVIQGLYEAFRLGALDRMPAIHAVQTAGGAPLARAWRRLAAHLLREAVPDEPYAAPVAAAELAQRLAEVPQAKIEAGLEHAVRHRGEFMWPWETPPKSLATGILDDETYDWAAVCRGMLATGGFPIVASEGQIARAHALAREHTGISADPTGTAGLAGLLTALDVEVVPRDESHAVLFTGVER